MRLVILGPPGSGKGTQAEGLRDRLSLVHLSTGDALRDAVKRGTELGRKAKSIMDAGGLVPDDLVAGIVEERLGRGDCERFLLDGFPRTVGQVEMLDRILERLGLDLDRVLLLDVPEAEVVRRLTGRRTCGQCGWVCLLAFSPPRAQGVCDSCGGALVQRDDDPVLFGCTVACILRTRMNQFVGVFRAPYGERRVVEAHHDQPRPGASVLRFE